MGYWEDKRRSVRVPVDLEASYSSVRGEKSGKILNLSLKGCLLQTMDLFDPGDTLEISIQIPGAGKTLPVKGTVAWGGMMEGTNLRTFGLGMRFENLSSSQEEEISQFLHNPLKA